MARESVWLEQGSEPLARVLAWQEWEWVPEAPEWGLPELAWASRVPASERQGQVSGPRDQAWGSSWTAAAAGHRRAQDPAAAAGTGRWGLAAG